ncbi:MAG: nucleotidyltransferase family protein [candidate division Zixibacteria bacterium]|nr:nucleotidyltransferase family protein [candidate division Zixibacteria bacterium]
MIPKSHKLHNRIPPQGYQDGPRIRGKKVNITGVILAAGTSSRMGSANKLLLKYREHTIIEETLVQMSNSRVDNILIVTGYESTQIEKLLSGRVNDRVRLIYNPNYLQGRAESIKIAICHIADEAGAALFMVADKPGVTSDLINRAIDQYKQILPAILYVDTPTGRGHPIVFSSALFNDLLSLEGDRVGNELVSRYEADVAKLMDQTQQIDIDDESDYLMALQYGADR